MAEHATESDKRQLRRPLGTDRVPVLPPGVPFLIQVLQDDDLDFREVARAIEHVPSIAARLLALANSAWSSPISPVMSLDAACSRLGLRVVRTASIALAVSQPFNPARCPPFDGSTFWTSALLNAEAASALSEAVVRDQLSVARTAGLLSNLGLVWLAESLPAQTGEALRLAAGTAFGGLNDVLADQCGIGYDEAGALLAEAWNLPPVLRDAIAHQFHPRDDASPLCRVVSAAARMAGTLRHDQPWERPDEGLSAIGMEMEQQLTVFDRLADSKTRTADMAKVLFGKAAR
ncbi:MAG: HDOD domain-containing protein [Gammaproteobacteria bacterium]|nr:HDOD domain-containing protein [Gammaproteobacteria bacterium]